MDSHRLTLDSLSTQDRKPLVQTGADGSDTGDYRRFAERVADRLTLEERNNSKLARGQDWKWWTAYCDLEGVSPAVVSADVLAAYAIALADGASGRAPMAPASILRRVSGVVHGWRAAGLVIPEDVGKTARLVAERHERKLLEHDRSTGRGQAAVLELRQLRKVCASLPDTVGGARDRALFLVGFGIAARRSELAHLEVPDIRETSEGLDVTVRFSKNKPRNPGVPYGSLEETCAVAAWRRWLEVSGVTEGAAFRQVSCHGRVGGRMSPRAVGEAISRAGARAGLDARITGHSLRAGLATEARRAGRDVVQIARQGGWSETSSSLYRYIRTVDKWTDNAVRGVL